MQLGCAAVLVYFCQACVLGYGMCAAVQGEEWFDGVKVDKEERNSYTGNAGPTMDRCHPSSSSLTAYPVSFRTEYFSCSVEGTLQPVKCTRACTFCLGADRQW